MSAKKRILSFALAAVMTASLALSGCSSAGSAYPGTPEAGSVTINISSEPPQMNSITTTDTTSFTVLRHIVTGLTTLDPSDKPIAGVAKDWTSSEDGLVWTFNLREDFKWSNGEPVTAHDFVFAYQRLVDPETAADYAYFGYIFENAAEINEGKVAPEELGVKALSDYQLELTLVNPVSYLLDMLAFGVFLPVNQKAYEAAGVGTDGNTLYGTDADKIAYNGPFVMSSWQHESEIILTKNPDYPNNADVKLDKIVMKMINDTNAAMNAFKSNEIDMIGLNGEQSKMLQEEGQAVYTYDDGSCWYFEFNLEDETTANKKLRQAIAYAADSESFVKNVVANNSVALERFVPGAINGNTKKFAEETGPYFKSHDVEAAKKLIEEAKAELNVSEIEVTFLLDDGDTAAKHGAFFQETLQNDLGIKINIEQVPFKTRLERMSNKDFQIVMAGWGPDYNDPMTFLDMFETGNGNNHTSYSNATYDELLDKVREETDRDTRFGYLMELETILMDDMPIAPYYSRSRDYTTSAKLKGIVRTAFQDINLNGAYIE